MKLLNELINNITYLELKNLTEQTITSISYDSRLCGEGTLFVALRGANCDAHGFIGDVIASGCRAVVCEELPKEIYDATFIVVESTRQALAEISHAWFDFPTKKMKMIGITGTNGKTTTTFLISQILGSAGFKTGIVGTTGIYFADRKIEATHTTPESFELCKIFKEMEGLGIEYAIMEVSSHALEQKRVYGIDFDMALFSNLTHDHLDYHETIPKYAAAKKILFSSMKESGIVIANGDDPYCDFMLEATKAKEKVFVGRRSDNDWKICDEKITLLGNDFSLKHGNVLQFKTKMLGKFNIDNAAISAVACNKLGIDFSKIIETLSSSDGAEGRMAAISLKTGAVGIVDYSHTPDALEKALKTCREIMITSSNQDGKLICVFGCGGDRDKSKRPIMGDISSRFADITIVTDDNPRTESPEMIRKDIMAGIEVSLLDDVFEIGDRDKAIAHAVSISKKNDIILVAGKGHEKYQINGRVKIHFDDFEELGK